MLTVLLPSNWLISTIDSMMGHIGVAWNAPTLFGVECLTNAGTKFHCSRGKHFAAIHGAENASSYHQIPLSEYEAAQNKE